MLIGYPVIVLIAISGSVGAPWWVAFVGAIVLTSVAVLPRRHIASNLAEIDQIDLFAVATAYSFSTSLIVSLLAHTLGRLAVWFV